MQKVICLIFLILIGCTKHSQEMHGYILKEEIISDDMYLFKYTVRDTNISTCSKGFFDAAFAIDCKFFDALKQKIK